MEINWEHVRRVIVNDGMWWIRPNRDTINRIVKLVPDAKILGFGIYQYAGLGSTITGNTWYFMVESKQFYDPMGQGVGNVLTSQLAVNKRLLSVVPKI